MTAVWSSSSVSAGRAGRRPRDGHQATSADSTERRVGASRPWASPDALLIAVCLLHALSPLVLVGVHHILGWDETVYASQYNRFVPPGAWSAPRARGVPLVVAPVTLLTNSTVALRLYLSAIGGLGLCDPKPVRERWIGLGISPIADVMSETENTWCRLDRNVRFLTRLS